MTYSSKKLIGQTSIYFAGNLLRRVVSFLMLPIYTRCLSTADYGVIELLGSILDFIGIIVGLRVAEALFRFYSEYEEVREKNEVITTGLSLVVALNVVGICIVSLFSKPISLLIFDNTDFARLLVLYSSTLLGAALIEIPMAYLRAIQRPWIFVFFSTFHLLTQLGLNVYFVVFRSMNVEGVVYSAVLSTLLTGLILSTYTLHHTSFSFSRDKAKQLISFSWPLIITSMITFYIVFGDRYFLKFYNGLSNVGIYSLAYKFGFLLNFIIVQPFFTFWQAERYSVLKKNNAKEVLRDVLLVFLATVMLFVVTLSITVKDILRLMADPSFWPACKLVPVLLLAYTFSAFSDFTNLGILIHKRTKLLIYSTLASAVVITIGYVTLIPRMGAMGAALATLIAYFVRFICITNTSQKLYQLDIPWKEISIISAFGLTIFGISQLGPDKIWPSILFSLFLSIVYLAGILTLPIWPANYRKYVFDFLLSSNRKIDLFRKLKK